MRATKLTLLFVYIADLFTHRANAEAEGFYKTNTLGLTGQQKLEAIMHNQDHLDRVKDGLQDFFGGIECPAEHAISDSHPVDT
jgi:hypothetical protein